MNNNFYGSINQTEKDVVNDYIRDLYVDCELSDKQFQLRYTDKESGQRHIFPDIDAFKDWQQKIFTFPHLDIRISRLLEDNATPADREAHIDLADWILKYLETNKN